MSTKILTEILKGIVFDPYIKLGKQTSLCCIFYTTNTCLSKHSGLL